MGQQSYFNLFNLSLQGQYGEIKLAKEPTFKEVLNKGLKAFKRLHKNKNYKPEELFEVEEYKALINETNTVFQSSIAHIESAALKSYLATDSFIFSGLKAHKQLAQARSLLKDSKGNIKPYYKFEQEIVKLNNAYNKNYLQAEYEFAVQSGQSASQWQKLKSDTDRFYLQYRTAKDEKVRDSHAALADTTLPKDDPFWNNYYPPNGWRCRCVAVEVLARNNEKSDSAEAIKKGETATTQIGKDGKNKLDMFRFNPGKNKKLFPPKNSYVPKNCAKTANLSNAVFLALEDEACRAKSIIEKVAKKQK